MAVAFVGVLLLLSCALADFSATPNSCPFQSDLLNLSTSTAGLWRENRLRFVSLAFTTLSPSSLIVLTGSNELSRYPFRQNSNFYYLTGANMPGYYVSIFVSPKEPLTPFTTLFVPTPSSDYAVWNGYVYTPEELRVMYDVDEVLYTNETTNYVNQFPNTTVVYTIPSSVAFPAAFDRFTIKPYSLGSIMTTSRATKSDKEIILMTLVNKISSFAHVSAMQFIAARLNTSVPQTQRGGLSNFNNVFNTGRRSHLSAGIESLHVPMDDIAREIFANMRFSYSPRVSTQRSAPSSLYEYEVESLFLYQCGLCGAMQQSYLPIVGSGNDGAILHFIANNNPILDGDMLLIDAGTEYWGYGSDITRTYPVNGVFTEAQTLVYNVVLQTQADVVAMVKAGVSWSTLNSVAHESITKYLLQAGFLQGNLSDLMRYSLASVFYPHGIGHSVGLDVHDAQTSILEANQVITVEPGVYFNSYLLAQARASTKSKFIVWDLVDTYTNTGGVRIEDDFVVTASGSTRITVVPNSIDGIEKIMQSSI